MSLTYLDSPVALQLSILDLAVSALVDSIVQIQYIQKNPSPQGLILHQG